MLKPGDVICKDGSDVHEASSKANSAADTARPCPLALRGRSIGKNSPPSKYQPGLAGNSPDQSRSSRTDPVYRREFGLTNAPLRCRSRQGENEATWWSPPTIWPGLRGPVNSPQITDCYTRTFT